MYVTDAVMKALAGSRGRRFARAAFLESCAALAVALLVQAFLAGIAAMTDPSWWELHLAWVNIFQCLVLLPPACAVLARYPKWLIGASALPILLLYVQYVWAELGLQGTSAYGLGIHAAGALVLLGTTAFLFAAAFLVSPLCS